MGQIILPKGAAAATPATGDVTLYAKTDGLVYSKDDLGAEKPLGGITDHTLLSNLNTANYTHLTAASASLIPSGVPLTGQVPVATSSTTSTWQTPVSGVTDHTLLSNLNTANHTHLTAIDATDLTDGGLTTLHEHDFDRIKYPASNFIGTPAHVYTLQSLMDHEWSAGVVDGCILTNNGNGTISIGTGVAVIRATADGHTTLFGVNLSPQLNIALTDNATNYVYLDYNAGAPVFAISTVITSFNCMNKCIAYMVHRAGNVLHYVDAREQNVDSNRKIRQLFLKFSRFLHTGGGSVLGSPSGLTLSLTAGSFFFMLQEITHDAFDTSVAGTANVNVFTLWTLAGATWTETANSKVISSTLYNNIASGTVTLGNNKFGVSWVYLVNNSPSELHVVMGQVEYANIADARVATPPTSVPTLIDGFGSLVGFVVYEKSNTVFNNVYSAFTQAFSPSLATTHNGLAGIQTTSALPNDNFHLAAVQAALVPTGTPTVGQVPTATSATTATWQTPAAGGTTGGSTDAAFYENDATITTSYTIGQASLISGATVTIATPGVVTLTGHGFIAESQVFFETTGALPTGLLVDTGYWVIATGLTANAFQLSLTQGGAAINTTGTQSGTHSCGKLKNATSAGAMVLATGVTITIPSGATWSIG